MPRGRLGSEIIDDAMADPIPEEVGYTPPPSIKSVYSERIAGAVQKAKLQRKFLMSYVRCGSINKASRLAGIDANRHYGWLKWDSTYKAAFQEAVEAVADSLEDEAIRRAIEGVQKPVFYQGEVCGYITEYSDSLLKFLLRGLKPGRYLERVDITSRGSSLEIIIDGVSETMPGDSNGRRALLLGPGDGEDTEGEDAIQWDHGDGAPEGYEYEDPDVDSNPFGSSRVPNGVNFRAVKDHEKAMRDNANCNS